MAELKLNPKFFSMKMGQIVESSDLDYQFNNVADYINGYLKTTIDSIQFDIVNGEVGNPASVFSNIDDDNVRFDYVSDIHIPTNYLNLSKLKCTVNDAVAVTNSDYEGVYLPTVNGGVLMSTTDNAAFGNLFDADKLEVRKVVSDDIDDVSVGGDKLGVLNKENLVAGLFTNLIPDMSLTQASLPEGISNEKIADGTITFDKIGSFGVAGAMGFPVLTMSAEIANQFVLDDFDNNSIGPNKILNGSIKWTNFDTAKPILAVNVKDECIGDSHFVPYVRSINPAARTLGESGLIVNTVGAPMYNGVGLTREKIKARSIALTCFSQEIQTAAANFRRIRDRELNPPPQIVDFGYRSIQNLVQAIQDHTNYVELYTYPKFSNIRYMSDYPVSLYGFDLAQIFKNKSPDVTAFKIEDPMSSYLLKQEYGSEWNWLAISNAGNLAVGQNYTRGQIVWIKLTNKVPVSHKVYSIYVWSALKNGTNGNYFYSFNDPSVRLHWIGNKTLYEYNQT